MVDSPGYTCPRCGAISYNPNDIRESYCGRCHKWGFLEEDTMTYPSGSRNYGKESQKGRMQDLSCTRALDLARQGWLIARQNWSGRGYVFFVTAARFAAFDNTVGDLEPFFVMRHGDGLHTPWQPMPEDLAADDWLAVSRQQAQSAGEIDKA